MELTDLVTGERVDHKPSHVRDMPRGGFDDLAFYELLERDRATWPMPVVTAGLDNAGAPFEAWLGRPDRTHY